MGGALPQVGAARARHSGSHDSLVCALSSFSMSSKHDVAECGVRPRSIEDSVACFLHVCIGGCFPDLATTASLLAPWAKVRCTVGFFLKANGPRQLHERTRVPSDCGSQLASRPPRRHHASLNAVFMEPCGSLALCVDVCSSYFFFSSLSLEKK